MKTLRIRAKSLSDALAEGRRQLGEGAMALHTKQYDEPILFGLARRRMVEALVAADTAEPPYPLAAATAPAADSGLSDIARQLSDIRHIIARLDEDRPRQAEGRVSPVLDRLVRNGVSQPLAELLSSGSDNPMQVMKDISRRIKCAGPIDLPARGQARVALVGPTGAGKTTTAAKLAAEYTLVHKKKVALLTLDTYRVGAVEQLATYARILNVPVEVALCPEDVEPLVARHGDRDLIIIDTVGRSQRDKANLDELSRLLRPARPTEVHLTISAQANPAAQKEAADAFRRLGVDRIIATKLDESPQPGCLLDLAISSLLPFSYLTFGQEVPDDIALADTERLSRLIWEGSL